MQFAFRDDLGISGGCFPFDTLGHQKLAKGRIHRLFTVLWLSALNKSQNNQT
jgi:hypothetical protein